MSLVGAMLHGPCAWRAPMCAVHCSANTQHNSSHLICSQVHGFMPWQLAWYVSATVQVCTSAHNHESTTFIKPSPPVSCTPVPCTAKSVVVLRSLVTRHARVTRRREMESSTKRVQHAAAVCESVIVCRSQSMRGGERVCSIVCSPTILHLRRHGRIRSGHASRAAIAASHVHPSSPPNAIPMRTMRRHPVKTSTCLHSRRARGRDPRTGAAGPPEACDDRGSHST